MDHHKEHRNDWNLFGEYKNKILKQIEKFKMAAKIQNGHLNVRFSQFLAYICLIFMYKHA